MNKDIKLMKAPEMKKYNILRIIKWLKNIRKKTNQ